MQENLQAAINRANEARLILESDLYQAAFTETHKEIIDQMLATPVRDVEAREKYYLMVKMLEKVQNALDFHISTGKIAKEELEYQKSITEKAAEMVKGWF